MTKNAILRHDRFARLKARRDAAKQNNPRASYRTMPKIQPPEPKPKAAPPVAVSAPVEISDKAIKTNKPPREKAAKPTLSNKPRFVRAKAKAKSKAKAAPAKRKVKTAPKSKTKAKPVAKAVKKAKPSAPKKSRK